MRRDAAMDPATLITIGIVRRPHGLAGEVRLRPETDFPERFASLREAYLVSGTGSRPVVVEGVRGAPNAPIVKFQGVDTAQAAGDLRGARLAVARDRVHPRPEGGFYVFEIVGLAAHTPAGERLGTVTEVLRGAAHDVYVVTTPGGAEVLVPALRKVVTAIDLAAGRMTVELPEGLRED